MEPFSKFSNNKVKKQVKSEVGAVKNQIDMNPSLEEDLFLEAEQKKKKKGFKGLNFQQRVKRGLQMKRREKRMAARKVRALSRSAPMSVLMRRARVASISSMKKRFAGGRNYNTLSVSEKQRIDRIMASPGIKRMMAQRATRLLPKVRQLEKSRLQRKQQGK